MQYFPVNQKSENRSTILLGNGRFAQSRVRFGPQIDGRLVQDAPVVRPNTQCQDEQSCNPLRAWLGRRLLKNRKRSRYADEQVPKYSDFAVQVPYNQQLRQYVFGQAKTRVLGTVL